jgi:hypothetical protein
MIVKTQQRLENYLSNTTQLACAFLASAETAPQGEPDTIFIFTLICEWNQDTKHSISIGIKEFNIHENLD